MIAFILSPIGKLLMVGLAGAAIGFSCGWTANGIRWQAKLGPLQAEVSRLQARSSLLEGENERCAASVETQNAALKLLESEAAKRQKRAAEALRIAASESAALGTALTSLRALQAPLDASCSAQAVAAAGLIADEIRGRK